MREDRRKSRLYRKNQLKELSELKENGCDRVKNLTKEVLLKSHPLFWGTLTEDEVSEEELLRKLTNSFLVGAGVVPNDSLFLEKVDGGVYLNMEKDFESVKNSLKAGFEVPSRVDQYAIPKVVALC